MKTVLIIDDDPAYHILLTEAIQSEFAGIVCNCELDFDKGIMRVAVERPDAVILDLMEGLSSPYLPGARTWSSIWNGNFCPIVIYSGTDADIEPPVPPSHPFVERVAKGDGSLAKVTASLQRFVPFADSVRSLRTEVDAVIHKVLRDTVGEGHMPMDDAAYLLHAGRRRIAAAMDDPTINSNRAMASWEQYLIPAIGDSPLTADVLRERGAQANDPTAYRLVLTPSCDLVKGKCVTTVLVARCQNGTDLVGRMSLSVKAKKMDESAKRLQIDALTRGVYEGFVPLPSFGGHIPNLVANLKNLEVLNYESIAPSDPMAPGFDRIASIDSPFREQVAWAYLATAARPGMPDRDLKSWAEELMKAATPPISPPSQPGKEASTT
jgi:hypothetical protein